MIASTDEFRDVPDNARVWIIPTDRVLHEDEQRTVLAHLSSFFERWESHGREVVAQSTIERDRFVVVTAFVPGDHVSGCGIDASDRQFDEIAGAVGFSRAPVLDIFYDAEEGVLSASRSEFAELATAGKISTETMIFDTSLSSAADWKSGMFARPVSALWHAEVFF